LNFFYFTFLLISSYTFLHLGYAKTLKNDIKIPLSNSLVNKIRKTSDIRLPYLVRDQKTGKWSRTENPVTDFTTLFKNYLIYKLTAQGGFKIR